jgi:hypothetical protein
MSRLTHYRPSPAMVVACTALAVALSGTSYAALRLPAKSVGTKQLKNGAVTNRKLARGAVTGSKVARQSLTGVQVNAATLGTVPSANHASSADSATTAQGLAAPEAFHVVGAPGEPGFQHSWQDRNGFTADEPLGFYKDREGVVHLRGLIVDGGPNDAIFQLPPGYRPASGKGLHFAAACECQTAQTTIISILGPGISTSFDGAVLMQNGSLPSGNTLSLDGITFRAES